MTKGKERIIFCSVDLGCLEVQEGVKKMVVDVEKFPFKRKWDITIGSPQKLFRTLKDVVEELGYNIEITSPPEPKPGAVPDTATFNAEIVGQKQIKVKKINNLIGGIILSLVSIFSLTDGIIGHKETYTYTYETGLLFKKKHVVTKTRTVHRKKEILEIILGSILLISGAGFLATSSETRRRLIAVNVEGESYKASLGKDKSESQIDRIGIISEARLLVGAGVTTSNIGLQMKWLDDPKEQEIIKQDFELIQEKFDNLLPTFKLPDIE